MCSVVVTSYLHDNVIFILAHTVVCMELQLFFSKSMMLQEVMEHADDSIGALPRVKLLVDKVIHLPWHSLIADAKNGAFSWGLKVYRAWL